MQANSVQHKVMISTVRIFFRNPVFFFISKPQFQDMKLVSVYNLNYIVLNIFFFLPFLVVFHCPGSCPQIKTRSLRCVACTDPIAIGSSESLRTGNKI